MKQIIYRPLVATDARDDLLSGFVRRQIVTYCRRRIDGEWRVVDAPFVDDWTAADRQRKLRQIRECIALGGFVAGALVCGDKPDGNHENDIRPDSDSHTCGHDRLVGFVMLEPEPLGSRGQYLDMSSLHVSADLRRHGIGSTLFGMAANKARELGAEKLYISAHSAVESQAFYTSVGCVDAEEYDTAHVKAEPYDCQLEYVL